MLAGSALLGAGHQDNEGNLWFGTDGIGVSKGAE